MSPINKHLQNRVAPDGSLHAVPERGTLMGNRGGRFHRAGQVLGRARWASHHWICCELQFKNRHHDPMGEGYTSLFFLDEVTALAAGHRPCFECRRAEARAMLGTTKADTFDRLLHAERLSPARMALPMDLPDGAMLQHNEHFLARRRGRFLHWSFAGYDAEVKIGAEKPVRVLTPPAILSILQKGYQPRWHASALTWDD